MTDLLELAINGRGGLRRWEQTERIRVAISITGAIWMLKSQPGPTPWPGAQRYGQITR